MLDPRDLRDRVVRPVLAKLALPGGLGAERLVMGTAAHESMGFTHVRQIGMPEGKGGLGLWQMEAATFDDLLDRYLERPSRHDLRDAVWSIGAFAPPTADHLVEDHRLAAAMCRVLYYSRPGVIREDTSLAELADLWKLHYNTPRGAGTPAEWLANFERYVAPVYRASP